MEFIKDYTTESTIQPLINPPPPTTTHASPLSPEENSFHSEIHIKRDHQSARAELQINIRFTSGAAKIYTRLDAFGIRIVYMSSSVFKVSA